MSIILVGFMGSGKTTVAKALTADYIDLDCLIEQEMKMSISDYFTQNGEARFRELESKLLMQYVFDDVVIATGGGIVESKQNRRQMQEVQNVVYLSGDLMTLVERMKEDKNNVRPLANQGFDVLKARYEKRKPWYEEVANFTLNVGDKSPEELAEEILNWQALKKRKINNL